MRSRVFSLYRLAVSPLLHTFAGPGAGCRFEPSCGRYTEEAVARFGLFHGSWLALRRLLRCHPFSRANPHDPVPERCIYSMPMIWGKEPKNPTL